MSDFLFLKIGLAATGALILPVATFLVKQEFSEFEEEQPISESEKVKEAIKLPILETSSVEEVRQEPQPVPAQEETQRDLAPAPEEKAQLEEEQTQKVTVVPQRDAGQPATQETQIVQNSTSRSTVEVQKPQAVNASATTQNEVPTPLPTAPQALKAAPKTLTPAARRARLKNNKKFQEFLKKRRETLAKLRKGPMQSRGGFGTRKIYRGGPSGARRVRM